MPEIFTRFVRWTLGCTKICVGYTTLCEIKYQKRHSIIHINPLMTEQLKRRLFLSLSCLLRTCNNKNKHQILFSRFCCVSYVLFRAGRKPMQPMQLHWAHASWAPASWGPAPWRLERLFIFARYSLRSRIQQKWLINIIVSKQCSR